MQTRTNALVRLLSVAAGVCGFFLCSVSSATAAPPPRHGNDDGPVRHGNNDGEFPLVDIQPITPGSVTPMTQDSAVYRIGPAPVFAPPGGGTDDDGHGGLPPLVGPDGLAGVGTYTAAGGSRGSLAGHGRLGPVAGTYGPLPGSGYGGTPVPEPTSALLLLAGGLALASGRRRRRHC